MADSANMKEVDFAGWCLICKHWDIRDGMLLNPDIGIYDGEKWSGAYTLEEYYPCCDCLEVPFREGTFKPERWEANDAVIEPVRPGSAEDSNVENSEGDGNSGREEGPTDTENS